MDNDKSKKYFWIFLDILLAALILNLFFFVMPMLDKIGSAQQPVRTITVSAEGKTTVKPDLAQFSFSAVTEGADLVAITKENNDQVAAAVKFVKEQGIPDSDIKTTEYNLAPKYDYVETQHKSFISGYTLTQTIFVKVKELDKNIAKISKIFGNLPEMGINQISNVSFTNEDPEKFMNEARTDAYAKAKEKADFMAKASGISLDKIVNIYEYQNGPIPYYPYASEKMGIGGSGIMSAPSAPIEPGTSELKLQVNITYSLK